MRRFWVGFWGKAVTKICPIHLFMANSTLLCGSRHTWSEPDFAWPESTFEFSTAAGRWSTTAIMRLKEIRISPIAVVVLYSPRKEQSGVVLSVTWLFG